jgi:predicted glycosyltransferase
MEMLLDTGSTDGATPAPLERRRLIVHTDGAAGLGLLDATIGVLRRVAAEDPALSILLVTSLPVEPYFALPPRCDTVRVPAAGELRRALVAVAARAFRPDVALIAAMPPADELEPTLFALRRAGCRLVLGLQDVHRLLEAPEPAPLRVAYA